MFRFATNLAVFLPESGLQFPAESAVTRPVLVLFPETQKLSLFLDDNLLNFKTE